MHSSVLFTCISTLALTHAAPSPNNAVSAIPAPVPGVWLSAPRGVAVQALDKTENHEWGGNWSNWKFEFNGDYKSERFHVDVYNSENLENITKKLEVSAFSVRGKSVGLTSSVL